MTRREYIKKLLRLVRSIGSAPGELEHSLPVPQEGSKGQSAVRELVSSPYFLAARKRDGVWYAKAESMLEDFAARIDAMLNPTTERIEEEIREVLEKLLTRKMGTDIRPMEREESGQEEFEDLLNNLLKGKRSSVKPIASEDDENSGRNPEEENHNENDKEQFGIGAGNSKEETLRRDNKFLRSIPKDLLKLAKLIGRSGSVDFKPGGQFPIAAKSDITGITVGDNLNALLPSETALLSCPATQSAFYRNYVEKRLQVFASASGGKTPVIHQDGPVIICLDTSGSMCGEKVDVACALTMAITIIAQRRGRDVLVVKYSDWHTLFKVTKLSRQRADLEKFLSVYQGSGNAENELFRWLFKEILPKEKAFDTADILCISDFGWEGLEWEAIGLIESYKRKGMIFYGLNVMDGREPEWFWDKCSYTMTQVCDSLWSWKGGRLVEIKSNAA